MFPKVIQDIIDTYSKEGILLFSADGQQHWFDGVKLWKNYRKCKTFNSKLARLHITDNRCFILKANEINPKHTDVYEFENVHTKKRKWTFLIEIDFRIEELCVIQNQLILLQTNYPACFLRSYNLDTNELSLMTTPIGTFINGNQLFAHEIYSVLMYDGQQWKIIANQNLPTPILLILNDKIYSVAGYPYYKILNIHDINTGQNTHSPKGKLYHYEPMVYFKNELVFFGKQIVEYYNIVTNTWRSLNLPHILDNIIGLQIW